MSLSGMIANSAVFSSPIRHRSSSSVIVSDAMLSRLNLSNLEASVMATMLCKEVGVKTVIAKCSSEMNCRILQKVGADRVVFPENESGIRLAKNLVSSGFVDILDLSDDVSMVELEVRPEWYDKTLMELNLRKKYSINIVAVIENDQVIVNIDPEKPLKKEMSLIVIADTAKLAKFR